MNSRKDLSCFKAYDVRGKLGDEFNEEIAYRIGLAIAESLRAKILVLGFDARETSPSLAKSIAKGVCDAGCDIMEIGLAGTEEVYAAVSAFGADAGIEVTASHNPINFNGMKIVKKGSQPLSDLEFSNIKKLAEENNFILSKHTGFVTDKRAVAREVYIDKLLNFVDLPNLKPLKIVLNSGNGAAGPTLDALSCKLKEKGVKLNFFYVNHEPDSSFPNGIPNPLLEENRLSTSYNVKKEKADFGVAFDGDFDRCFLFDQQGNFVSGEYIVGLLSEIFLNKEKGATIVHDPRVIWNTRDVVTKYGGKAIVAKTGHAFVKAAMRDAGAIYGGEMSAHHYFRDFAYCDSGMIPWLMIWELLSKNEIPLSELILDRVKRFPSSGEMNFNTAYAENRIQVIKNQFAEAATSVDELDGLSMSFDSWRFNLRKSNTEDLVRLNLETIGDRVLLREKTEYLKGLIKGE